MFDTKMNDIDWVFVEMVSGPGWVRATIVKLVNLCWWDVALYSHLRRDRNRADKSSNDYRRTMPLLLDGLMKKRIFSPSNRKT